MDRIEGDIAMDGGDRPRILVVDDDPAIVGLVRDVLGPAGMEAVGCTDADGVLALLDRGFDLVLLDVMMPGVDGFELCARIRARSRVPVIFLSARDEETDKVVGLTVGADDYVTKPFLPRELVARIRSCLRRASYVAVAPAGGAGAGVPLRRLGIELDRHAHRASLHGEELALTPKEFDVLAALLEADGAPVSARDLYEGVWGEPYLSGSANSVMVHIRHLRAKLAAIDSEQAFIQTVWGVGYKVAR